MNKTWKKKCFKTNGRQGKSVNLDATTGDLSANLNFLSKKNQKKKEEL